MYIQDLHLMLTLLIILSGFFVVFSRNPIDSILFLILCFFNAGTLIFIFGIEFLGLTFIIVYIGAIVVLFLFIIIMLDIKERTIDIPKTEGFSRIINSTTIAIFSLFLGIFIFFSNLTNSNLLNFLLNKNMISDLSISKKYFFLIDNLSNIDLFGQILYNYFLLYVLIAGFTLLIALIGSITLTLNFNSLKKKQLINKQLSRTDKFISFFK